MSGEDPCEGLLEKKYGEVMAEEDSRRGFFHCLNSEVFKIDSLFFSLDEDSLSITFPSHFFAGPSFYWGGRPSDTRIKKFYETMKNLERKIGGFFVDRRVKPSSTNLSMKLKFYFTHICVRKGIQVNEMTIRDIRAYLKDLWWRITSELVIYGYAIRPRVF